MNRDLREDVVQREEDYLEANVRGGEGKSAARVDQDWTMERSGEGEGEGEVIGTYGM